MLRPSLLLAVLAGICASAGTAAAGSVVPYSPSTDLSAITPQLSAVAFVPARQAPPTLGALGFRPRRSHPPVAPSAPGNPSPIQLHMGFFEPGNDGPTSFVSGFRVGPLLDRRAQFGVGLDWIHNSEQTYEVMGDPYYSGGVPVMPTRVLSNVAADALPTTGFLQVNLADKAPLIPYVGVAGGYQWLFLTADDYVTGASYDATFGGWTWQTWGGIALPLSRQVRLSGEFFYQDGDAARDLLDSNGVEYREVVDLSGTGMRFGLSFGY